MKTHIWNNTQPFPGKVNFIDTNNVLVGFDYGQCCCENTFWKISANKDGSEPIHSGDDGKCEEFEIEGYSFDPEFFEDQSETDYEQHVIFKLVPSWDRQKEPPLYLRLENHHNGYYSHGFTFKGAKVIQGSI